MNPKIDDPKTAPDTTGARPVDANNMAFAKFGFIGTPSIVADSGDVIPVSVVDARLQQARRITRSRYATGICDSKKSSARMVRSWSGSSLRTYSLACWPY
ncbi:hypothetical protein BANRA_05527 [Klebsiella pneumoniae]|nr:hypothetical protein BANRA_05527 [Klebsiella pneumoniae]